jgi:hypothetical protein
MSLRIEKNMMKTIATAIIPKSSGLNLRDNMAVTTKLTSIPEYLAIAV